MSLYESCTYFFIDTYRGSFGDIQDRQLYYHLEPLGDTNTVSKYKSTMHVHFLSVLRLSLTSHMLFIWTQKTKSERKAHVVSKYLIPTDRANFNLLKGTHGHATSDQQLDAEQLISHKLDTTPYRV